MRAAGRRDGVRQLDGPLAAALAALLLLAPAPGCAASCLDAAPQPAAAAAAKKSYAYDRPGRAFDARGVLWRNLRGHALRLEGAHAACWSGGRVDGPYPEDAVYECSAEHCPAGVCPQPCWPYHLSAGVSVRVAAPTVIEDLRVSAYGDGISQEESAQRADLEIRRVWLHDIHDDAVENDWGASVRVIDSLLERVNIAFASRSRSGENVDARSKRFEVRNSLVLLHRFTNQYKQRPGHGGFWKWGHEGLDPRFAVTDNVFVAETPGGLLFPLVDQVLECRNNRLLWLGTAEAWEKALDGDDDSDGLDNRGRLAALSHCYTVVLRPAAQSRAAFLAEHWDPLVRRWRATHSAGRGAEVEP
jgi:hypothetical protein